MPPVSLISQAQLRGEYIKSNNNWEDLKRQHPELPNQLTLTMGASYGARNTVAA